MRTILGWAVRATILLVAAVALSACHGGPHSFTVNTSVDGSDANPGDGVCEMTVGGDDCSLRAAVDEANTIDHLTVTIDLPAGTYDLGQVGVDDANAVGDLDVDSAAGWVIIRALGDGAVIDAAGGDRVVDAHTNLELYGVAVTGGSQAGAVVRSGAALTTSRTTSHGNAGTGFAVEVGATAELTNSTASDNGGGAVEAHGPTALRYVTVTANDGGGLTGTATYTLEASVVGEQRTGDDCESSVVSLDYNLDSDGTCDLSGPSDVSATPPQLGPLKDAVVPFHAPDADSPLLDVVPAGTALCHVLMPSDLRGIARPQQGNCDRGAVESLASFEVDAALDGHDLTPGDGTCHSGGSRCSLRAAAEEANALPGHQGIAILAGVDPVHGAVGPDRRIFIEDDTTIEGYGATVDAVGLSGVVVVRSSAGSDPQVTIEDLTITGGGGASGQGLAVSAGNVQLTGVTVAGNSPSSFSGGALAVSGGSVVTVASSSISANQANSSGGGILVNDSTLIVEDSMVSDNVSGRHGGGLYVSDESTVTISDSTIDHNIAEDDRGGAIAVTESEVTITGSSLSENSAPSGPGGGLYNSFHGHVDLIDTTVSDNTSGSDGGGIYNADTLGAPSVDLLDSTLSGNTAAGLGGGIYNAEVVTVTSSTMSSNSASSGGAARNIGSMTMLNSTVADNQDSTPASGPVGGVELAGGTFDASFSTVARNHGRQINRVGGTASLRGSVVADADGLADCAGSITSLGGNIGTDASCSLTHASDLANTDPLLGLLADNGGPTHTLLPAPGSPAIGHVPSGALCAPAAGVDQRGVARPQNPACDAGSVEQ